MKRNLTNLNDSWEINLSNLKLKIGILHLNPAQRLKQIPTNLREINFSNFPIRKEKDVAIFKKVAWVIVHKIVTYLSQK